MYREFCESHLSLLLLLAHKRGAMGAWIESKELFYFDRSLSQISWSSFRFEGQLERIRVVRVAVSELR